MSKPQLILRAERTVHIGTAVRPRDERVRDGVGFRKVDVVAARGQSNNGTPSQRPYPRGEIG